MLPVTTARADIWPESIWWRGATGRSCNVNTYYHNSSSEDRLSGFHQALEEALPVSVYETNFDEQEIIWTISSLPTPMHPIQPQWWLLTTSSPGYVICRMQSRGLLYPKNLSMIGSDNLHAYLPLPFPLTSISSSKITLSRKAVERLLEQIQHPGSPCPA